MTDKPRYPAPTEQAAMDARPGEPDASGLPGPAIIPTHEGADAFWKYWRENGETHRHGYFESTWGAINAALRVSGVTMHIYAYASGDPINPHVVSATPEPQPDFEAMQATINKQQLAQRYDKDSAEYLDAEAQRWHERYLRLKKRNAALREALREYLDWHETNFVLPSGNFEDPDQMALAKAARAALEAGDE